MLIQLKKFFITLSKVDRFLRYNQIKDYNGLTIIFLAILVLEALGIWIKEKFNIEGVSNLGIFLLGTFSYCLIPYMFFKSEGLRTYILIGKKQSYEEIFQEFSFKSYVVSILLFGYLSIFPILGIPLLLQQFTHIDILTTILKTNITIVVYVNIALGSIIWFAYHIITMRVRLQKIKSTVSLYSAIGSTIILVFNSKDFEDLLLPISCILLSYLWIRYLIELRTEEIEGIQ